MAKDLPYFKFFVSEWSDGDVTLEDYSVQGVFINVCAYYWSNGCNISYEKLCKKFKSCGKELTILENTDIIKIDGELVFINFLDEQLAERGKTSVRNSKAGKASAEARRLKKLEQDSNENSTPVKIPFNENSTIKRREEKKREDKETEFNLFWEKYPKKIGRKDCLNKWMKLKQSDIDTIFKTIDDFILHKPFKDYTLPHPKTYLNQERWNDLLKTEEQKFPTLPNYNPAN